jgi:hypothetical protein
MQSLRPSLGRFSIRRKQAGIRPYAHQGARLRKIDQA